MAGKCISSSIVPFWSIVNPFLRALVPTEIV
jgi:hypothetical protein